MEEAPADQNHEPPKEEAAPEEPSADQNQEAPKEEPAAETNVEEAVAPDDNSVQHEGGSLMATGSPYQY